MRLALWQVNNPTTALERETWGRECVSDQLSAGSERQKETGVGDGEIEKVGKVKGQKEVEGQTREKGGKGMCEEEEGGGERCQSDTIVTGTSVVMPVGGHHRLSILSHHPSHPPSAPKWKVSPAHTTPQ